MTHYADLSPCEYFGLRTPRLRAVGWLEAGHDFAKGPLPPAHVIEKLAGMIVEAWQPTLFMGFHKCSFCRLALTPPHLTIMTSEMKAPLEIAMGMRNVFVPGRDGVYVAPSLVLHYVDAHEYALPDPFVEAVRTCPPMGSAEYLAALRAACPELVP